MSTRTLVLCKPDAVERGLVGEIVGRLERKGLTIVARGLDPRRARVDECMSDRVFACYEDDLIESCMWLMSRHQVRRIPVVYDRDRVVGVVSQADVATRASANQAGNLVEAISAG